MCQKAALATTLKNNPELMYSDKRSEVREGALLVWAMTFFHFVPRRQLHVLHSGTMLISS
jgi:hypothetical protein